MKLLSALGSFLMVAFVKGDCEITNVKGVSYGFAPPSFYEYTNVKVHQSGQVEIVHMKRVPDIVTTLYLEHHVKTTDSEAQAKCGEIRALLEHLPKAPKSKSDYFGQDQMLVFSDGSKNEVFSNDFNYEIEGEEFATVEERETFEKALNLFEELTNTVKSSQPIVNSEKEVPFDECFAKQHFNSLSGL